MLSSHFAAGMPTMTSPNSGPYYDLTKLSPQNHTQVSDERCHLQFLASVNHISPTMLHARCQAHIHDFYDSAVSVCVCVYLDKRICACSPLGHAMSLIGCHSSLSRSQCFRYFTMYHVVRTVQQIWFEYMRRVLLIDFCLFVRGSTSCAVSIA